MIQQPSVGHHIDRAIGGFHLHSAQGVLPMLPDHSQCVSGGCGPTEPVYEAARFLLPTANAKGEDDLTLLPGGQIERNLDGSAGVQTGSHLAGELGATHRGRIP